MKYTVEKFIKPKEEDYDDFCILPNLDYSEEDFNVFRNSRINSPMGKLVQEDLGLVEETKEERL